MHRLSLVAEHGLFIVVASFAVKHGLLGHTSFMWPHSMRDLNGPGVESVPYFGRQVLNHWTTREL